MKILIKNATLVSMDEKREQLENNIDILIDGNKIIKIEKNIQDKVDKIIDASGKVVLPGLINTHAHIPMSIFRETIDNLKLQDWLEKRIWPMEAKLTKDDIYYASMLSFIEMIRSGCTTVNDMYFLTEGIIKAKEKTKIRLQTTTLLIDNAGREDGNNRLDEFLKLVNKYKDYDDTLSFNAGIHGLYTSDEDYIKECVKQAKKLSLPVHIHFCENEKERSDIINSYKKDPAQVLIDDFKDVHTILAHSVKLEDKEIEKLKDLDVHVSTCPVSNLKLGCGVAKISKMLENGINVSIGTDGQGSGTNLDLFESMKFVALLQKGMYEDPTIIDAYGVLKMATINGAIALGLENKIGSITEGKNADLIIIDLNKIKMQPTNDLIAEIVYNATGTDVETTIVNGEILMENKLLKITVDENEIIEKCNEIINKIIID